MEKDLFNCNNSSEILSLLIEFKKSINPRYSLSMLARTLKLKNHSSLSHILAGKRSIPTGYLENIAKAFSLNKDQVKFIKLISKRENAKTQQEIDNIEAEIQTVKMFNYMMTTKVCAKDFFTKPIYVTLGAILRMPGAKLDSSWIKSNLVVPYSTKEINKALDDMIKWDLIEKTESGMKLRIENCIAAETISPEELAAANIPLTEEFLDLIKLVDPSKSQLSLLTLTIDKDQQQELIRELRVAVLNIVNKYEKLEIGTPTQALRIGLSFVGLKEPLPT